MRCYNKKHYGYKWYGARGIKVCGGWETFKYFVEDMFPSFKEGLVLDRIDNDGNYEPSNCRWVTKSKNSKNKRHKARLTSNIDHVSYLEVQNTWYVAFRFKDKKKAEQFAIKAKELV